MAQKYYYRAVCQGEHNAILKESHRNLTDALYDLQELIDTISMTNDIVFIGVQKFRIDTGEKFEGRCSITVNPISGDK